MNISDSLKHAKSSTPALRIGDKLPDFHVVDPDLQVRSLKDFPGKKILLTFPSVDTPVCDIELKFFDREVGNLDGFTALGFSMDLPFAQKRWLESKGIRNIHLLSDYRLRDFAGAYGVFLEEPALCARAVLIADDNNQIIYTEYLDDISEEPDYFQAIIHAKEIED